ncbi:MAG TPA: hypothetical protein VG960_00415 [Caulobacteraceae bacterium]|nr:hypothetical protein [Caulobacteraceae bacterium]
MILRTMATFRSDLADNGVEAEDTHDFIEWPGRAHALVLADILQAMGWRISKMVDSNEHGWELEAKLNGNRIWMQISPIDEIILMFEGSSPIWTWFFAPRPTGVFPETLTAIDAALHADGRFHDLRWFTNKEYQHDAPGAPTPVSDIQEMAGYASPPLPPRPWREWDHPWRDR